jgi:uncharacterized glyoxalase superfamily protein PhnB
MAELSRVAPELPTADVQSALVYSEQQLGFHVATKLPDYAIVERDKVALHLFHDGTRSHSPVGVHIFSRELDALYAEFQRRGACLTQEIMRKPWGNRDFRVKDEYGNELKFTEPLEEEVEVA